MSDIGIKRTFELLNLAAAEKHVFQTFKEQMSPDRSSIAFDPEYDQVVGFRISRSVARHVTEEGRLFVVLGSRDLCGPITAAEPLHVGVMKLLPDWGRNNQNMIDDHHVTLFPEDILSAPVIGQIRLFELPEVVSYTSWWGELKYTGFSGERV